MYCQQARCLWHLAVHTGFGNETFCRQEIFLQKVFFYTQSSNLYQNQSTLYYKEEIVWSFYGPV